MLVKLDKNGPAAGVKAKVEALYKKVEDSLEVDIKEFVLNAGLPKIGNELMDSGMKAKEAELGLKDRLIQYVNNLQSSGSGMVTDSDIAKLRDKLYEYLADLTFYDMDESINELTANF